MLTFISIDRMINTPFYKVIMDKLKRKIRYLLYLSIIGYFLYSVSVISFDMYNLLKLDIKLDDLLLIWGFIAILSVDIILIFLFYICNTAKKLSLKK